MQNKHVLLFRLEGVLQSWGEHSKWDYRDTSEFPTKSGIIGLIGCAMGVERGDPLLVSMSTNIRLAIRADRAGELLTDFHTVQSAKLLNAEGKPRNQNTIVSHRNYLQDASFLVAISGPEEFLQKIHAAFHNPRWQLYLGRKSCVPSVPILGELRDFTGSLEELLVNEEFPERHDDTVIIQMDCEECPMMVRSDEPKENRNFINRGVKTKVLIPKETKNVFK